MQSMLICNGASVTLRPKHCANVLVIIKKSIAEICGMRELLLEAASLTAMQLDECLSLELLMTPKRNKGR